MILNLKEAPTHTAYRIPFPICYLLGFRRILLLSVSSQKMSTKRWMVTYTKHMKQKRKVYQDGVLELCSSSGKPQVMLYDDCEKLIDRRFLKKDEIVISGGTLSFETHIVDIGDPDGNIIPSIESNMKSGIRRESQKEKLCVEWNVLYTNQMTQKAKRYHDGILRVLVSNSKLYMVTLLNEDGALLSSKYLKSFDSVETGKSCEFPNYLVEICERRASTAAQEGSSNVGSSCKDLRMKDSMNQVAPSKPEKCGKLVTSRKIYKIPMHSVPTKEVSECKASNASASVTPRSLPMKHSNTATLRDVPTKEVSECKASNARAFVTPRSLPMEHSKKVTNNCSSINSNTATLRDDPTKEVSECKASNASASVTPTSLPMEHSKKVTNNCSSINSNTATLRDALGILSVLKKPSPERSLGLGDPFVDQCLTSQPSDKCQLDLQDSQEAYIPAAILVLDADRDGYSSEKDRASSRWPSGVEPNTSPTKSGINNTGEGQTCAASTVLATSDTSSTTKDPPDQIANVEGFPTFDLGF